MAEITEAELKKQIDKAEFSPLYVLHGEETFLVERYAQKLVSKAAGESFLDFNLQRFDGASVSIDEIADAVEALPFMAERKCVAVSNLDVEKRNAQEQDKLKELIANIPETTVLVIFLTSVAIDYKKSSKWKSFFAAANKTGSTIQLKRRENADLEKLLCTAATKRFCNLSRQDAARIIFLCGNDLQILYSELDKLCSFVGQGEITPQIIDQIVVKNLETTVFILAKALIAGEYEKAYKGLDLLFYQNEEPVTILAVLASSYVDMYRVRTAVQSGQSCTEPAKYFDYKGKEFRLRNADRDVKNLSTEVLRESLNVLLQTDIALKSSRTSSRILMEELIAKLLMVSGKGHVR